MCIIDTSISVCVCVCMHMYAFLFVCEGIWGTDGYVLRWYGLFRFHLTYGRHEKKCIGADVILFSDWNLFLEWFLWISGLPIHPYLTVLVRKSASSMDVCTHFSKYGQTDSRKYGNRNTNECELVASEADRWVLMELSFIDIWKFQAIRGAEV